MNCNCQVRLLGATLWEYYLVNLEAQQEELGDFTGNIQPGVADSTKHMPAN